jgi:hypothetical protein
VTLPPYCRDMRHIEPDGTTIELLDPASSVRSYGDFTTYSYAATLLARFVRPIDRRPEASGDPDYTRPSQKYDRTFLPGPGGNKRAMSGPWGDGPTPDARGRDVLAPSARNRRVRMTVSSRRLTQDGRCAGQSILPIAIASGRCLTPFSLRHEPTTSPDPNRVLDSPFNERGFISAQIAKQH